MFRDFSLRTLLLCVVLTALTGCCFFGIGSSCGQALGLAGDAGGDAGGDGSGGGSGGGGSSSKNLEVAIDFLDRGADSNTSAITFERSRFSFDTTYYDGSPEYSFEIVAYNSHATNPYTVTLKDAAGTDKASVNIPANVGNFTRFRGTFTPNTGADTYRLSTPATAAMSNIVIYGARVLVKQTAATKTRLYIPLTVYTQSGSSVIDAASYTDQNTGTTYTQGAASFFTKWVRNLSAYGTLASSNPLTFEAVFLCNASCTADVALTDSSANVVANVSTTSSTPDLQTTNFTASAANFTEGGEYTVRTRRTGGTNVRLYRAGLWITLNPLSKGEVYYRVDGGVSTSSNTTDNKFRVYLDTGLFSSPTVYFEATTQATAGSGTRDLATRGAVDVGGSASAVVGSTLTFSSMSRQRSGSLSLVSGDRFTVNSNYSGGGNFQGPSAFLVVGFQ